MRGSERKFKCERERDRETERQRDRKRQKDRETERQRSVIAIKKMRRGFSIYENEKNK